MANWDFVFLYDEEVAAWLAEQDFPHPEVDSGNRFPCAKEVMAAWRKYDQTQSLLIDNFNWEDESFVPEEAFKLREDRFIALQALVELCERCGQLLLYPDTGEPAIIVDRFTNAERAARLHAEANDPDDGWSHFFEQMYGVK